MGASLKGTLRDLLKTPAHHAPGDSVLARALHLFYRKEACLRLLLTQMRDIHRRRRPPASLED